MAAERGPVAFLALDFRPGLPGGLAPLAAARFLAGALAVFLAAGAAFLGFAAALPVAFLPFSAASLAPLAAVALVVFVPLAAFLPLAGSAFFLALVVEAPATFRVSGAGAVSSSTGVAALAFADAVLEAFAPAFSFLAGAALPRRAGVASATAVSSEAAWVSIFFDLFMMRLF